VRLYHEIVVGDIRMPGLYNARDLNVAEFA
jgi:hypothetical protein